MKIQGQSPPSSIESLRTSRERTSRTSTSSSRPSDPDVQVSTVAKVLGEARAPETPDVDRIGRLREQVESGRLTIDAERIADAMLREER
jgi:flagellar biosynthesis anti-sigma factor FlgM